MLGWPFPSRPRRPCLQRLHFRRGRADVTVSRFSSRFARHLPTRKRLRVSRVTPRPLSAPSELCFDALAGRGHALFLETLIFNELQNEAWKRGQKKSAFPRLGKNGI